MKEALIVFVKNLQYGKVKTRLAESVGNDKAFEVYGMLLQHTFKVINKLECDKYIFYSEFVDKSDIFSNSDCTKEIQRGTDLGEKMLNAFSFVFKKNYRQVVIIGSDCAELLSKIVTEAFHKLNEADVVIGPASDGGYYLLGLNKMNEGIFKNISWSTSQVLQQTLEVCEEEQLSYGLLPELNDIDTEEDWKQFCKRQVQINE